MYCRYCGEPIDPSTLKCTSCGRENGPLTNGSSFWDVAGEKERGKLTGKPTAGQEESYEAVVVPPLVPAKGEKNAVPPKTGNEKGRKRSSLPLVLQAVGLLAALVAIGLLLALLGKLDRISSQNDEIQAKIESKSVPTVTVSMEDTVRKVVEDEKKTLQQSIKALQDKVDELARKIDGSDPALTPEDMKDVTAELEELEFKLAQMEYKLDKIN